MKRFAIIATGILLALNASSQSEWLLDGLDSVQLRNYFYDIHNQKKYQLKDLQHSYYCDVFFKIDTNGNLTDYLLVENPKDTVPSQVKDYIQSLFMMTNGKWRQRNNEKAREKSGDFLFTVFLFMSNQTMETRIHELGNSFLFQVSGLADTDRFKNRKRVNYQALHLFF